MGVTVKSTEKIAEKQGRAQRDGVYTLGRSRFRIRAGDPIPPGAVLDQPPAERSRGDAPENNARPAAPENKAKGGAPQSRSRRGRKDGDE